MTRLATQKAPELHGIVTSMPELLQLRHWAQKLDLFKVAPARSSLLGNFRSNFRGRGMEFAEVRRYHAGDDVRSIDWKVTARTQQTHTKLFTEEREKPCHIIVDQRSSLFFGSSERFKSVTAAEAACAVAWAALSGGDRISHQILSCTGHTEHKGKQNRQAVLRLAHNTLTANTALVDQFRDHTMVNNHAISLQTGLEECQRLVRPGTALFIVSDFQDFDSACLKTLSLIARHCEITLIRVSDPLEATLNLSGSYRISDGAHIDEVNFNASVRAQYAERQQQHNDLIAHCVLQTKAHYVELSTASSTQAQLGRYFRARK